MGESVSGICDVGKLRCREIAVWESSSVGELQCGVVRVFDSCNVGEWHCGGDGKFYTKMRGFQFIRIC